MTDVPPEVQRAFDAYGEAVEPFAWGILAAVIVYLFGRLVLQPAVLGVLHRRNERNPTLVDAVERYVWLSILAVALLVGVSVSQYGDLLSGSALVVAAATLALGVAGQDVIGNLVSGLFLVADPEFNVGDWIRWEGGEGVVETIRFRETRIRTGANEVVTVPNTALATSAVTRPYSRNRLRLAVRVDVPLDSDLDRVLDVLREQAARLEAVRTDPPPSVTVEGAGDGALELRVTFWLRDPTRRRAVSTRAAYVRGVVDRLAAAVGDGSTFDGEGALRIHAER